MATTDMTTRRYKVIGSRPVRHDGIDKVTGSALYGADIDVGGMLHGKALRSPHAHARLLSVDASRAVALPGSQGSQGPQGHVGSRGAIGPAGIQGPKGGPPGPMGKPVPQGRRARVGERGPQGIPGTAGVASRDVGDQDAAPSGQDATAPTPDSERPEQVLAKVATHGAVVHVSARFGEGGSHGAQVGQSVSRYLDAEDTLIRNVIKRAGVNAPFAAWQDVAREGLSPPRRREHTIKRREFTSRPTGKLCMDSARLRRNAIET